jgi:hypothetical protein
MATIHATAEKDRQLKLYLPPIGGAVLNRIVMFVRRIVALYG